MGLTPPYCYFHSIPPNFQYIFCIHNTSSTNNSFYIMQYNWDWSVCGGSETILKTCKTPQGVLRFWLNMGPYKVSVYQVTDWSTQVHLVNKTLNVQSVILFLYSIYCTQWVGSMSTIERKHSVHITLLSIFGVLIISCPPST